MNCPRLIISALRGGSGKTILSLGIVAALKKAGFQIAPFKKGPDYIDAGWLSLAAGRPCYNLDTFLIDSSAIKQSFSIYSDQCDFAIIEGNRGLYDAIDTIGRTSTAELGKTLATPLILCIDCTKTTRTMAAVVSGCCLFDPDTPIKAVVLNRVAGHRHEQILRNSIEGYCHVPVIGAIPKLRQHQFPERHMGLVPTAEHDWAADAVNSAAEIIGKHIDLDHLIQIARQAPSDAWPDAQILPLPSPVKDAPVIGVIRDSAFQFYYAENLEALQRAGAQLEFFSALTCSDLPRIDALYIGGGFPETHARQLADNVTLRKQIRQAAHQGLPVYAECGGLMYLGEALELEGKHYPMVGIFPAVFGISRRPRGHGYTVVDVSGANPFFPVGVQIKGHEFHYSSVVNWRGVDTDLVFDMNRGEGFFNRKDGLRFKNVLATYTHIHAQGTPVWAPAMVRLAGDYRQAAAAK